MKYPEMIPLNASSFEAADWIKQQYMTASECDKMFGTDFVGKPLPNMKQHPLYRKLNAAKEERKYE